MHTSPPSNPVFRFIPLFVLLSCVLLLLPAPACADDECEPHWVAGLFCPPGITGFVDVMAIWDDGTEQAVYVGGSFTIAGCANDVQNIAKWDGTSWSSLTGANGTGVNDVVRALQVFDDGSGPALYVGGNFTIAGGVAANRIARWSGTDWSALTTQGGNGVGGIQSARVQDLVVFDDGTGAALYAGGAFSTAGGVTVNNIAKWNGTSWLALAGSQGTGVSSTVNTLAVFDDGAGPALYTGGHFTFAGGIPVNRIARWDGTEWTSLTGSNGEGLTAVTFVPNVRDMVVFDDGKGAGLFVGGVFTTAGGTAANRIAKWDGSEWHSLSGPSGNGINEFVNALAVFDDGTGPVLYAGGMFSTAGGISVENIAAWNGSEWSTMPGVQDSSSDASISSLIQFDDASGSKLIVGGVFNTAGGEQCESVASWSGSQWTALVEPANKIGTTHEVHSFATYDDGSGPALFVGGPFTRAGGVDIFYGIAKWDGQTWSELNGPGPYSGLTRAADCLVVFDDGLGGGPALYAGGSFTLASGITANRIARWNGTTWSALEGPNGIGMSGIQIQVRVAALKVFDEGTGPALYAGGHFTTAGGVTVNHIARWNGTLWSALTGDGGIIGVNNAVEAIEVFDDGTGPALYVGGAFITAGGVTVNRIARWNGTTWSALSGPNGTGVTPFSVYALTTFDDGTGPALYAAGNFGTAGGASASRIARWDGTNWSSLGIPGENAIHNAIRALTVFDDGTGPALFACGAFYSIGNLNCSGVAKWNGFQWSGLSGPAGIGVSGTNDLFVRALAAFDDGSGLGLYVGGSFKSAGGIVSENIAKWQACPMASPPCPADVNGDGVLNFFDIQHFLAAFSSGNPAADFNGDGTLDFFDVQLFLGLFAAGCD
ncbi:MAG: hypothetical protein KF757_08605 [Phycisphaeraceae bacterium]|nr:hypothetical protein [Phycisphaeraceae bacterium]MCW5762814.1 hypothetical protein [Phycisphaeraceae bacterium]